MFTLIQRFVCVYFSTINVMFLFFKKSFTHFSNLLDILFFSCYEEVEDTTRCRRFRLCSNLKMMSLFFFVYFISCEFSLWWVAMSCLSIVVCVHSFKYSKTCLMFRRRIENVLTQSISAFCLTCLTMRLICTMMILCNSFCLTFVALS